MKAYLERGRGLLEASMKGTNPFDKYKPEVPTGVYLKPGEERMDHYEKEGTKELHKTGFVLIAGGLGAFCSRTLTSPLSVCQVNMQTSVGVPLPFRKAVQSIYHTTGLIGFWAGNSAALARIVPSAGLKFSLFRNLHDSNLSHNNVTLSAMGSGALAGSASVLVLHPIDVIKIQMVVRSTNVWPALGRYASTNVDRGIRDAAAKIFGTESPHPMKYSEGAVGGGCPSPLVRVSGRAVTAAAACDCPAL
jgi:hypothetical protein